MKSLLWIVALLIVAGLFVAFAMKQKRSPSMAVWPFYAKKPLSQVEQILYFRLVQALPEYVVLAQVQLSRFLGVTKGEKHATWNNRINRMSVDFLICRKDFTIVAAIELDDKTHERAARIEADERKNKALAAAKVPIVRWNVKALPEEKAIRASIDSFVEPKARHGAIAQTN